MRRYAPALVIALCAFFALFGCELAIQLLVGALLVALLFQAQEMWGHYRRIHRG